MQQLDIYQNPSILRLSKKIKPHDKPSLKQWLSELELAVIHPDKEKYQALLRLAE